NYDHFGMLTGDQSGGMQRVSDMIQRITGVLDRTREPNETSVAVGRADKLLNDTILQKLDKLHLSTQKIRLRDAVGGIRLTEEDWKKLQMVATFQAEKITFSSKTPDRLTDDAETALAVLADKLRQWPKYYLRIEGNTSSGGDPDANRELANSRAAAVR